MIAEEASDDLRPLRPPCRVPRRQAVERLGRRHLLAADRKAQRGDRLVEQAHPGGAAGDRLFVEQLFHLVGKLMVPEGPGVAQPGSVTGKLRRLQLRPQVLFLEARSEEHTSELQSLMRISYAVFCLKKKK